MIVLAIMSVWIVATLAMLQTLKENHIETATLRAFFKVQAMTLPFVGILVVYSIYLHLTGASP